MSYQPDYSIAYGSNYESTKDLDVVEVAKRIKSKLKVLYPDHKWSVRTQKYSGGQSIRVTVREIPDDLPLYNPEWLTEYNETGRCPWNVEKYTKATQALLKGVESLVESYNYDGSDTMTDYFNVRFYKSVDIAHKVDTARRESELEDLSSDSLSKEEKAHALVEVNDLKAKLEAARRNVARIDAEIAELEAQLH